MASKGQIKKAHAFVQLIQKEGSINKFDLMDKLSISIATYNQLKPYVEYRYGHYVEYVKESKTWRKKEVLEESTASQEMAQL